MSLGSDIVIALNALSETDKRDMNIIWEAIGAEIEAAGDYLPLVGGTLTGDLTLSSGVDILHTGTNADKYFYLASDAYIHWDESEDEFIVSKYFNASSGLKIGSGEKIHKLTISISPPSDGADDDLWFIRDSVAADFSYALVQTVQYTADLTCSGAALTWLDYGGSPHITIDGAVGEKWIILANSIQTPGNSGYNHVRFAPVAGCTVDVDGQIGYLTSGKYITMVGIITLTGTIATIKFQHWSSNATGTHTISGGVGGSGNAPFDIVATRVAV